MQSKHSLEVKGVCQPSGEMITTPIPLPKGLEAPSNTIVHQDSGSGLSYGPDFAQSVTSMMFIREVEFHGLIIIHGLMGQMIR